MPRDPQARVVKAGPYQYVNDPQRGPGATRQIVYEDGTIETRFVHLRTPEQEAAQGALPPDTGYLVDETVDPTMSTQWRTGRGGTRSPEEQERDRQLVESGRRKATQESREEAERQRNQEDPTYRFADTNAERAKREADNQAEQRAQETAARQAAADRRQADQQAQSNWLAQQNYNLAAAKFESEQNQPTFLSQAGESNPYIVRANKETGQLEQTANPNYDAVKVQGERLRQQLATQIQARQVTLEDAKQQYTQWFDSNVKIPIMQSQEARDRAAEQRQALDAEERRRQFAANFGLQKAELGQRAGAAAMSAEESLLPYRAGPTEAAEMSSAINSLAAGGTLAGPSASAGINFTPEAFQFDAPNFKKIASEAAKSALKGLTDYKPSDQQYQTADYSGAGTINPAGAPQVPAGYGQFQDIIDNLKSTYNFGGQ